MKVYQWLGKLHSHSIYPSLELATEFKRLFGKDAPWHHHTIAETVKAMKHRGLGGYISKDAKPKNLVAYGYEIAEALGRLYAPDADRAELWGRGFRFQQEMAILKEKGI